MPPAKREQADALRDAVINLHRTPEFQVGDVVEWRPGMRNRRLPKTGFVAVISEIFAEPIVNPEKEVSSPYFQEKMHGKIALMDEDGDILEYAADFTRFKKAVI